MEPITWMLVTPCGWCVYESWRISLVSKKNTNALRLYILLSIRWRWTLCLALLIHTRDVRLGTSSGWFLSLNVQRPSVTTQLRLLNSRWCNSYLNFRMIISVNSYQFRSKTDNKNVVEWQHILWICLPLHLGTVFFFSYFLAKWSVKPHGVIII